MNQRLHTIPGIEAYSALVVIKHRRSHVTIIDGLFDIQEKDGFEGFAIFLDETSGAGYNVEPDYPGYDLRKHNIKHGQEGFRISITVCVVRKIDGKCIRFITNATGVGTDSGFMRARDSPMELYLRGVEHSLVEDAFVAPMCRSRPRQFLRLDSIDCIEMQPLETHGDCTEELLRLWAYADSWM